MHWIAALLLMPAVVREARAGDAAIQVLASRCWSCHGQAASGGLRLDSREGLLRGGKSGPSIVPGDSAKSRIYVAIARTQPSVKAMPPGPALPPGEIAVIKNWIDRGASWDGAEDHWAFRPLRPVRQGETIDGWIEPALRLNKLTPNPPADKRTLIRRAHFDLIGLPPDEADFAAAYEDHAPDWFARLVTRLLDSPHLGEKWGRHWLDVARFGEDDFSGTAVISYANGWRYRDWVVEALNRDLPYDRFLMAQIAGDLMNDRWLLPATGLLGLGPWYYGIAQPPQARADERHDRIDAVTRGMLGVTVACARCHDHKYDPISTEDYYGLAGVFAGTAYRELPLVPEAEADAWKARKKEVDEAEHALNKFLDGESERLAAKHAGQIAAYMMAAGDASLAQGLNAKVLDRWKAYLREPEESHPFLRGWFAGERTQPEAEAFERLLLEVVKEKKELDEENRRLVEDAKKTQPKVVRTIVLPGGYRSEEDFNPGAYIPSKSLERDRFVAWNRTLGEKSAPLKFDRELTAELLEDARRPELERLRTKFETLKKALPPQYAYLHGAAESEPTDLNVNLRGDPESPGAVVPRRFPAALSGGKPAPLDRGSGRLQLAEAVARHPLAARVAVNRMWLALFGEGLVRTPSNFGRAGDRPALPELLEHLAARFAQHGYSTKATIREIMLSDAYRRSSAGQGDNRLWWRQNRRRLDAERFRDAMLAISGELDRSVGGESKALDAEFRRRTIYAKTSRFQPDETLSLFDLPAAAVTCEQRVITNVPLQKLFLLNSETVARRAAALAKRVESIEGAYRLVFQRAPSTRERELGQAFLDGGGAWQQYARVLLASNELAYVD